MESTARCGRAPEIPTVLAGARLFGGTTAGRKRPTSAAVTAASAAATLRVGTAASGLFLALDHPADRVVAGQVTQRETGPAHQAIRKVIFLVLAQVDGAARIDTAAAAAVIFDTGEHPHENQVVLAALVTAQRILRVTLTAEPKHFRNVMVGFG